MKQKITWLLAAMSSIGLATCLLFIFVVRRYLFAMWGIANR